MKTLPLLGLAVVLCELIALAQVTLTPTPLRVFGHPRLELVNVAPNWVEGRELNRPEGVTVDEASSALYIADAGNNRVLIWRNAFNFLNGAPADAVLGQRDRFSTFPLGPGTNLSTGFNRPTAIAVHNGNAYVLDSGNHRILRFPNPLTQSDSLPDMVIGQSNFATRTPGLSERNLNVSQYGGSLRFDAMGNLFVTDSGNRRVLRFPASALAAGRSGPPADMVFGQPDFISVAPLPTGSAAAQVKDRLGVPLGLAFDASGRLYVTDHDPGRVTRIGDVQRVLIFTPPFERVGNAASRVLGVARQEEGRSEEVLNRVLMIRPHGIAILRNGEIAVADSLSHRILMFPPFDEIMQQPETAFFSPEARAIAGQADFSGRRINRGLLDPADDRLALPEGLAAAGDLLYVADSLNNRVVVFPEPVTTGARAARVIGQMQLNRNAVNLAEGRELFVFTQIQSNRNPNEALIAGGGIALDSRSNPPRLYVADTGNNRVLGFRDARLVRSGDRADLVIGQPDFSMTRCNSGGQADQSTASSLCLPIGLAVDEAGNLYVADAGNSRVLRFPSPFEAVRQEADLVLGQSSFTGPKITDPRATHMSLPYGVAVGPAGVYVSDLDHHRVLLFPVGPQSRQSGVAASAVLGQSRFDASEPGVSDTQFNRPRHLALDTQDRLYVADSGNGRVLMFSRASMPGTGPRGHSVGSGLRGPFAVLPGSGENIWVADSGALRVVRFARPEATSPNAIVNNPGPLALVQSPAGAMYIVDAANRIAIHFPALAAVNAANFLADRPLAPGMIASIFVQGIRLTEETRSFNELPNPLPLPREMGGLQVLVNGATAPLFFVSPGQINFQVPNGVGISGSADVLVMRRSTSEVLAAASVPLNEVSPALFTSTATGSGPVAALNEDGSVVSPANPARTGSIVSLFGNGQGLVAGAPAEGEAAAGIVETAEKPRILLNNTALPEENVLFSGLAPGLVGVWQINFRIPADQRSGNAIPLVVQFKGITSADIRTGRITTIAVR